MIFLNQAQCEVLGNLMVVGVYTVTLSIITISINTIIIMLPKLKYK